MKRDVIPDPMRGVRRVLAWALLPTMIYMVYAATTGIELPSLARRPGPYVAITWSDTPVQFFISGISVYVSIAFFLLVLYGIFRLVRKSLFDKR